MRDLVVLTILLGSLPFIFTKPFVGVLVWSWIEYMNPHRLTFGAAFHFPVGNVVAAATICGLIFGKGEKKFEWERETFLLLLLWGMFTLTSLFAFYPEEAWNQWKNVSKVLLLAMMTLFLVHDERTLRWLYMVIALSFGFYGLKTGLFSILSGGRFMVWGPPRSYIEANTMFGLALSMALPLLWYLSKTEQRPWFKRLLQVVFIFSIPAILFTYSRGAFLGLSVAIILLTFKSGKAVRLALALALLVAVGYSFVPDRLIDRQKTIISYREDRSAMSRLFVWEYAWNVAKDRPFVGGGFEVYSEETFSIYMPETLEEFGQWWDAHSIYFGMMAEHGFVSLALFLGLIVSSWLSLQGLKSKLRNFPEKESLYNYCQMVEISLCAYAVSGAFLDAHYFSLFYQLVATVVILKVLVRKWEATTDVSPAEISPLQEKKLLFT